MIGKMKNKITKIIVSCITIFKGKDVVIMILFISTLDLFNKR